MNEGMFLAQSVSESVSTVAVTSSQSQGRSAHPERI